MSSDCFKIRKTTFGAIISLLIAATPIDVAADNILSVSDSSIMPDLIHPESYETDTKEMLENWYLQNYIELDYDADSRTSSNVTDEELLDRLGKLPNIIEMPLNSVVRNSIVFYINHKQLVENMLGLSLYYMPIFEEALERHGLPLELRYLPVIESALQPNAVSKAGAAGLWQFMPATGKSMGLEINSLIDQRRDPYLSSDAAARYLKELYKTYDDWALVLAAYNCGSGNVNKALRRLGDGKHDFWSIYNFLPAETRGYVPAFIAANYIMTYYKHHNISPVLAKRPIITDTIHVSRRVHFDQISDVMSIPKSELRLLNPQFRQDLIPGDIRPYSLVLPSLQTYAYIVNEDSIVNYNASKYARRGIVQPASGTDSRGEYVYEKVTKYHKVKRGETVTKIASKYGVNASDIRKANNLSRKTNTLKRGRTIKVPVYERKYIENDTIPTNENTTLTTVSDDTNVALSDSVAVDSVASNIVTVADTVKTEPEANIKSKVEPKAKVDKKKTQKPQYTYHTVRRGESLYKISRRYGVSINDIKKANNLTKDAIQQGKKLKIPNN